jgi:hypothetical protein
LKRKNASLENDNQQLQDVLGCIRNRPPQEVAEIVKRIRTSAGISDVLRFIQDGDLVQQQQLQHTRSDQRQSRIDANALQGSRLKVQPDRGQMWLGTALYQTSCLPSLMQNNRTFAQCWRHKRSSQT